MKIIVAADTVIRNIRRVNKAMNTVQVAEFIDPVRGLSADF